MKKTEVKKEVLKAVQKFGYPGTIGRLQGKTWVAKRSPGRVEFNDQLRNAAELEAMLVYANGDFARLNKI